MSKTLNKLFWHDGNLADLSFSINEKGKSFLQMTAFFYKDEHAPDRDKYQIRCEGVSRFNSSLDAVELKNNMWAGNISSAYLKDSTLWVYFTDGILEINANKFRLIRL